jgi:ferredoxin
MNFASFVEGPLLWIVFFIFIVGALTRLTFFLHTIKGSNKAKELGWKHLSTTFFRLFLPFHRALVKRPLYSTLRYIFHICLFIVPVFLSGHIVLWEESRFEWAWTALPDRWADGMTLIVLFFAICFLFRHIAIRDVRLNTSKSHYFLIILVGLPFMTGWFLAHGNLDSVPFIGDNIQIIHVLSSEAMLLFAAFLFVKTRLNPEKCTGCASCELSCPTGTLESNDNEKHRIFSYSHYQCITCGACINACPEGAAELRHDISLGSFFQISSKYEIRSVDLKVCERCRELFAPVPQMDKIGRITSAEENLGLCSKCKKENLTDSMFGRSSSTTQGTS